MGVRRYDGDGAVSEMDDAGYDYYVEIVWLAEWGFAVCFSLFARWRARSGEEGWESWCLLPAYDWAIVCKKLGLVLTIVMSGFNTEYSFGGWVAKFVKLFSMYLYQFTYITVLYALWAPSGGTRTMVRSIAMTIGLAVFVGLMATFNEGGYVNSSIEDSNTAFNTTYSLWPSFTAGGIGESGLTSNASPVCCTPGYSSGAANYFWVAIAQVVVGCILALGVAAGRLSPPRQPQLFTALYILFVMTAFADYFTLWTSVYNAFGFKITVLWGVIEVPAKYYIMLVDSMVSPLPPLVLLLCR